MLYRSVILAVLVLACLTGTSHASFNSIAFDQQGAILIGYDTPKYTGLIKYNGSAWEVLLKDTAVTALAVDRQGMLWVGTYEGLKRFDGVSWQSYRAPDDSWTNWITALAVDSAGALWVGSAFTGVYKFAGNVWEKYSTTDGLVYNLVNTIAGDANGTMWFGTRYGLSRFDGSSWKTYTVADGLGGDTINAVAVDGQNRIWVGTIQNGVSVFDGSAWTAYSTADGLADNNIASIAVNPLSGIWVGTAGGLSRFDGATWITPAGAEDLGPVGTVAVDSFNIVWAAIKDFRLAKYDGFGWTTYNSPATPKTSVSEGAEHPASFGIRTVSPNPFNPSTEIEFTLDRPGKTVLSVYSVTGQRVETLTDGMMNAGMHRVVWSAAGRASGIYFVTLESGGNRDIRKVTFMK